MNKLLKITWLSFVLFLSSVLMPRLAVAQKIVEPMPGECWWGAVVDKGYVQPFRTFDIRDNRLMFEELEPDALTVEYTNAEPFDLAENGARGFTVPFLLSNKGRYVWSDRPFAFRFEDGKLLLYDDLEVVKAGETLRDAYLAASSAYFPFDGREPGELLFTKPQFNNWIESAVFGINQENAEKYVDAIAASGFPCGVVTIDGGWQVYHGKRDFHPDTFPDAVRIFDKIHSYGYKGMLWCSYFLSADSRPEYVNYKPTAQNILVRNRKNPLEAALVWWWNGISVTMDLTSPSIRQKFTEELKGMAKRFHIDGFKFDGGDPEYFRGQALFSEPWMTPADFGTAFNLVGESFPYNEYRAGFKTGGRPLVLRLHDVGHSWEEMKTIIPNMTLAGLCGYPYAFPDMIGGGLVQSYMPGKDFSHKLFIRSCQLQALMPMMQFSAAPWRVLTAEECEICRKFAILHTEFAPYIMNQVHHASSTGEPILRSMEYEFPGCGYEKVDQQFMLGPRYLVAPVLTEDDRKTVYLPKGAWRDDLGKVYRGPQVLELKDVPIDRLPYYERMNVQDSPKYDLNSVSAKYRKSVLSSANTVDAKKVEGTCYYVSTSGNDANDGQSAASPIRTLKRVNELELKPGDAVLFRRGDVWRRTNPDGSHMIYAKSGVTYSAYGKGPKPVLNGSPSNGAREGIWTRATTPDVYVYNLHFGGDVGALVLDGRLAAQKVFEMPQKDMEFFQEGEQLYFCCVGAKPSERFQSIEFNVIGNGFRTVDNVVVDNFHICHIGSHGIGSGTTKGLTVTNCEIGWIGGSIQPRTNRIRYGNGVEIYGGCREYLIQNCWVYQCYDAGITHQFSRNESVACLMENVAYKDNLIEDCTYSIEYFIQDRPGVDRMMSNVLFEGNVCLRAGSGWGAQRPDKNTPAHIKSWTVNNPAKNFVIRDNIFAYTTHEMFEISFGLQEWCPIMRDNVVIH